MNIEQKILALKTKMEEYSIELAEYEKQYPIMTEVDLARLSFRISRMVSTLDAMSKDLTADLMLIEIGSAALATVENEG